MSYHIAIDWDDPDLIEVVRVDTRVGDSFTTIVRGQAGTTARPHAAGAKVRLVSAVGIAALRGSGTGTLSLGQRASTLLVRGVNSVGNLGLATETDTGFAIVPTRRVALGEAVETETAFAIAAQLSETVGLATETDAARSVILGLRLALETDTALAVAVGSAHSSTPGELTPGESGLGE